MLTLEQVKKSLNDPSISDSEALEIRDQMYSLAEIIFEQWQLQREQDRKARSADPTNPEASDSRKDSSCLGR
jgi:hypothetical protein